MDFGDPLDTREIWSVFNLTSSTEKTGSALPSSSSKSQSELTLDHFWNEVELLEEGETQGSKGCTLEVLLRRIVSLNECSTFEIWTFLLRLRSYTSPGAMLSLLCRQYNDALAGNFPLTVRGTSNYAHKLLVSVRKAIEGEGNGLEVLVLFPLRLAIVLVLEVWLSSFPEDFLPDSLDGLYLRDPAVEQVLSSSTGSVSIATEEDRRRVLEEVTNADTDILDIMDVLYTLLGKLDSSDVMSSGKGGSSRDTEHCFPTILRLLGVIRETADDLYDGKREKTSGVSEGDTLPTMGTLAETDADDSDTGPDIDARLPAMAEVSMAARRCIKSSDFDDSAFCIASASVDADAADGAESGLEPSILQRCPTSVRRLMMLELGSVVTDSILPVMNAYSDLATTLAVTELQSLANKMNDPRGSSSDDGSNRRLFNSAVDKMFISPPRRGIRGPSMDRDAVGRSRMTVSRDDEGRDGKDEESQSESWDMGDIEGRLDRALRDSKSIERRKSWTRRRLSGRHSMSSTPSSSPTSSKAMSPDEERPASTNPFEPPKEKWRPGFFMRKIGKRLSTSGKSSSAKEDRSRLLLDFDAEGIAETLTLRLHYLYCCIPLSEFIVNPSFSYSNGTRNDYNSSKTSTPLLHRLRRESERLQTLLVSEILSLDEVGSRAEALVQLVVVCEHLMRLRCHHAVVMIMSALQSQAIHRLSASWAIVDKAIPGRWTSLTEAVGLGAGRLVQGLLDGLSAHLAATGVDIRNMLDVPETYVGGPLENEMRSALQYRREVKESKRHAQVLKGLPHGCLPHMACMPYVNGFISRLLRVNQPDDYILVQTDDVSGEDDTPPPPPRRIINATKNMNTAVLIAIMRSCQLTPYENIRSEPEVLKLLLGSIDYASEEEQWTRSKKLEPSSK